MKHIPPKADPDIQRAFREMWDEIDRLKDENIDMQGKRRCINAVTATRGDQYVTLEQVESMLVNINNTLNRLRNLR